MNENTKIINSLPNTDMINKIKQDLDRDIYKMDEAKEFLILLAN